MDYLELKAVIFILMALSSNQNDLTIMRRDYLNKKSVNAETLNVKTDLISNNNSLLSFLAGEKHSQSDIHDALERKSLEDDNIGTR